jgi:uncharacterized protein YrzB (UPF0473 family)
MEKDHTHDHEAEEPLTASSPSGSEHDFQQL